MGESGSVPVSAKALRSRWSIRNARREKNRDAPKGMAACLNLPKDRYAETNIVVPLRHLASKYPSPWG
jgi:hypothetical protein